MKLTPGINYDGGMKISFPKPPAYEPYTYTPIQRISSHKYNTGDLHPGSTRSIPTQPGDLVVGLVGEGHGYAEPSSDWTEHTRVGHLTTTATTNSYGVHVIMATKIATGTSTLIGGWDPGTIQHPLTRGLFAVYRNTRLQGGPNNNPVGTVLTPRATQGAIDYSDWPPLQVTDGSSVILRFAGAEYGNVGGYFNPNLYPAASSNILEWYGSGIALSLMQQYTGSLGGNRYRAQNFNIGTGGATYSLYGVTGGIEIVARPSYP